MARGRVPMLDLLRGFAMILVVLYHLLYDLVYVGGYTLPSFLTPGDPVVEAIHIGFLWILFAVSGICSGYSRNLLRRGVLLYLAGFAITVFTSLCMPSSLIVFGILSCFGACMVLTALAAPVLDRIPWWLLTALGIFLWVVFRTFYVDGAIRLWFTTYTVSLPYVKYLYPLGILGGGFYSTDYFPIIPFFFMFLAGRGLYRPVVRGSFPKWFYRSHGRVTEWIGRHSLAVYIAHQPILFGLVWLLQRVL